MSSALVQGQAKAQTQSGDKWVFVVTGDSTGTGMTWSDDSGGIMVPNVYPMKATDGSGIRVISIGRKGGTAKADVTAHFTLKALWRGADGKSAATTQAPGKVGVRAHLWAGGQWSAKARADGSGTADNGVGSPVVDQWPYNSTGGWNTSGGYVLRSKDNGGHSTEVEIATFTATASAQATSTASTREQSGQQADVMAHAGIYDETVDNRSVTISRGVGAKRWDDPSLNKDHDEWVEADGTGHGHTTHSYNWVGIGEQVNAQNFQANLNGTWTWKTDPNGTGDIPNVTWSWSPTGVPTYSAPGDTEFSSRQNMPFGSMNKQGQDWTGTATKSTDPKTITYTATDNGDGAKGTGKYILRLHDPWEKLTATVLSKQMINLRIHPQAIAARCTQKGESVQIGCSKTFDWSVGGSVGGEPAKLMAGVIGIGLEGSVGVSVGAETFYTRSDIPVGWGTHLEIYDLVDVHSGTADQWNAAGYVGVSPWTFSVPSSPASGSQVHQPYYQITSPGGTPSPGNING